MSGLLALLGGSEHMPGCEAVDAALLDALPTRPNVLVVPFASAPETVDHTVALAERWWARHGAVVDVARRSSSSAREVVDDADLIVLTGGVPDRLFARLAGTALWEAIGAAWRRGAHLLGSSAGAMVLAGARQMVRPPFRLADGFGVLPGVAVAPHYDVPSIRLLTRRLAAMHRHVTVLGIDEHTALVGRDATFEVHGPGRVTILRDGREDRIYGAGDVVTLNGAAPDASAGTGAAAAAPAQPETRPSPSSPSDTI